MVPPPPAQVRPDDPTRPWAQLALPEKRDRILLAATSLFGAHGLEVSMPQIAAAAGSSVGSLYRQFPSKDDLVLALALRRMEEVAGQLDEAEAAPDARTGLEAFLWATLEVHARDDVLGEAISAAAARPDAVDQRDDLRRRIAALVHRAVAQGTLRADADWIDVQILFLAARAVKHAEPTAWRRAVDLLLDGLRV